MKFTGLKNKTIGLKWITVIISLSLGHALIKWGHENHTSFYVIKTDINKKSPDEELEILIKKYPTLQSIETNTEIALKNESGTPKILKLLPEIKKLNLEVSEITLEDQQWTLKFKK